MKNIVILGCENSHAQAFLNIMKNNPAYADIRCVGVYSCEAEPPRALHELFGVPVMQSFDEAVGRVDGVIITARDGKNHYPYAKPYLPLGLPMFIDKPIASSEADAAALVREAAQYGCVLSGGSCCKYADLIQTIRAENAADKDGHTVAGLVRAPISLTNNYGGCWFYAQHLVEMVSEAFGRYPRAVRAARNGGTITALFRYPDYDVTGVWQDGNYRYYAARLADGGETAGLCDIGQACFDSEFSEYARILRGGSMEMTYRDFAAPVCILAAVERALASGLEESVTYTEV